MAAGGGGKSAFASPPADQRARLRSIGAGRIMPDKDRRSPAKSPRLLVWHLSTRRDLGYRDCMLTTLYPLLALMAALSPPVDPIAAPPTSRPQLLLHEVKPTRVGRSDGRPARLGRPAPRLALPPRTVRGETPAAREGRAPRAVKQVLGEIRKRIGRDRLTFRVGYTSALDVPIEKLTGLRLPTDPLAGAVQHNEHLSGSVAATSWYAG